MAACPPLTIDNLSDDRWQHLKALAQRMFNLAGVGDTGSYDGHGLKVQWRYAAGTLTVEIADRPAFLSCDFVLSLIRHGVMQA